MSVMSRYSPERKEAVLRKLLPPYNLTVADTRQDAAILNIQRACEAALDMGHHLIRR